MYFGVVVIVGVGLGYFLFVGFVFENNFKEIEFFVNFGYGSFVMMVKVINLDEIRS